MLQGKTVVLGITGSIAAYKMANVASMLAKQHCDVQVIMTKNATQFITPLTFETLCNTRCMVDTFDRNFQYNVEHVALAKRANLRQTSLPRWHTALLMTCSRLPYLPAAAKNWSLLQ